MDFYLTALLQGLCFSSIAVGIFISMKIFNIPDITTDGSYTLGGVVTAVLIPAELPTFAILPVVLAAGALAGAFTGLIHTKLKINPLLAGILVMTALYSVNLALLGRSNFPLIDYPTLFTTLEPFEDPNYNTLVILAAFVLLLSCTICYILKTDFGIAMRATGNSESMIRALGVNTDRMKIVGLAIANSLTAISGFLISQFQGYTDISMGIGVVIVGLGSVIIAETFTNWLNITSIVGSIAIVVFGAILFQLVLALVLSIGVDSAMLKLVTALFVLLIVSLPRVSFRRTA